MEGWRGGEMNKRWEDDKERWSQRGDREIDRNKEIDFENEDRQRGLTRFRKHCSILCLSSVTLSPTLRGVALSSDGKSAPLLLLPLDRWLR